MFVKVEDVPDSAPRFTKDHYIVSVVEVSLMVKMSARGFLFKS